MNVLRIRSTFSDQLSVMRATTRLLIRVAAIRKVMTKINERIVSEAESRSQNLLAEELVELVEIYHPNREMGVSRETVAQYSEALANGAEESFNSGAFDETVDARTTDIETWVDSNTIYSLGNNRISVYSASWHGALSGSTNIREYVRFLRDDAEDFEVFGPVEPGMASPRANSLISLP